MQRIDLNKSLHVDLAADVRKYTGCYIKKIINTIYFIVLSNKKPQNESVKRSPPKADQILVY